MPNTKPAPISAKQLVADLAAHLCQEPTREAILEVASAMNAVAVHALAAPGRSVALQIRNNLADHAAAELVRAAAKEMRSTGRSLSSPEAEHGGRYIAASLAAGSLGLNNRALQRMMKMVAGRRALGWPYHVGSGLFMVPVAAIGDQRAAFLISLPDQEPPHPVPLPGGYEK